MKGILISALIPLIASCLYCESNAIPRKRPTLVKVVAEGQGQGQIAYSASTAGGAPSPITFFLPGEGVYVIDQTAEKINVYDFDFNFVREIKEVAEHRYFQFSDYAFAIKGQKLIGSNPSFVYAIDSAGNYLFQIDKVRLWGTEPIYRKDMFPLEGYVFFYQGDGFINVFDEKGSVLGREMALEILRDYNAREKPSEGTAGQRKVTIGKLLESGRYLLVGDKYYNSVYARMLEYFENYKGDRKADVIDLSSLKMVGAYFIGYDAEHNSYWYFLVKGRKLLLAVYSRYGQVLDAFYYDQMVDLNKNERFPVVQVTQTGELYFMVCKPEGTFFYHLDREW